MAVHAELEEKVRGHAHALRAGAGTDVVVATGRMKRTSAERAGARVVRDAAIERRAATEASVELVEQRDAAAHRAGRERVAAAGAHAVGEAHRVRFAHAVRWTCSGVPEGHPVGVRIDRGADRADLTGIADAHAGR